MSKFLRTFARHFPLGNRVQRYEYYRRHNEKNRMVKQRILQIIDNKKLTKSIFFQKTGLKRGFLDSDKLEQAVSDRQIAMIIAAFPDVDTDWLITGKGEMLRTSEAHHPSGEAYSASDNHMQSLIDILNRTLSEKDKQISQLLEIIKNFSSSEANGK